MSTPTIQNAGSAGLALTILLSVLLGFASISTDLYLPALPSMGESLNASQGTLELTVSGYLLGFSVGQLFWGPLSDRYGRKLPLMAGLVIFIVGAAGCALSTDAFQMIGWRIVQALGASAAVVLARAMVRDLFHRDEAARIMSTLMMIMGIAPLLGPTLGAQILAFSSWHVIFWCLVGIGLATFVGVARTTESLPPERREHSSLLASFRQYGPHLRNHTLIAYAGILAGFAIGVFGYVAGSAFVFIEFHGLSPEVYGLVFASGIVGIMLANAINQRLIGKLGSDHLLRIGTLLGVVSGLVVLAATLTGWGGLPLFAAALFVFVATNGLVGANAIAGGLASVQQGTGSASALLGFAQYGGGMIGAALVGALANGTPSPMGIVIAIGSAIAVLCVVVLARSKARDAEPQPLAP